MTARAASSTNIAWWHRFSAPTGQVRIGLLRACDHGAVTGEGLGVGQLMVMAAPGTAGRTGR
jgi:hypothetical protein